MKLLYRFFWIIVIYMLIKSSIQATTEQFKLISRVKKINNKLIINMSRSCCAQHFSWYLDSFGFRESVFWSYGNLKVKKQFTNKVIFLVYFNIFMLHMKVAVKKYFNLKPHLKFLKFIDVDLIFSIIYLNVLINKVDSAKRKNK